MGVEPLSESWETCADGRRHKSAIRQSEKQGPREIREAILGDVLNPSDSNCNLAEAATPSLAVSWESKV
jgi:hypothetical protein